MSKIKDAAIDAANNGSGRVIRKPHKRCNHPYCSGKVVDGESRCERHLSKAWGNNRCRSERKIMGRTLQTERKRLFREQPLCVLCLARGEYSPAVIRDHIVPLAEGGADARENTQGLCIKCNIAKTKKESQRGRR